MLLAFKLWKMSIYGITSKIRGAKRIVVLVVYTVWRSFKGEISLYPAVGKPSSISR